MEGRQSMLDVVKNGLQSSGRSTFLHRVVYIGAHQLSRSGLEECMRNIVSTQTDLPKEESLTGFLLIYHNHFIHLVEGSESVLRKHFKSIVNPDLEEADKIGNVKVVLEIAHINKRCMTSWGSRTATPPTLASLATLDVDVAQTARHMDAVVTKALRLVDTVKKQPTGAPLAPLSQSMALQLPEAEVVQALVASPLLKDVRVLLEEQRAPPRITLYDDTVWPMQSDFVPYNLLEQPIEVLRPVPRQVEDGEEAGGQDARQGAAGAEQTEE